MVTISAERLSRISLASFKAAGCSDAKSERISELPLLTDEQKSLVLGENALKFLA